MICRWCANVHDESPPEMQTPNTQNLNAKPWTPYCKTKNLETHLDDSRWVTWNVLLCTHGDLTGAHRDKPNADLERSTWRKTKPKMMAAGSLGRLTAKTNLSECWGEFLKAKGQIGPGLKASRAQQSSGLQEARASYVFQLHRRFVETMSKKMKAAVLTWRCLPSRRNCKGILTVATRSGASSSAGVLPWAVWCRWRLVSSLGTHRRRNVCTRRRTL